MVFGIDGFFDFFWDLFVFEDGDGFVICIGFYYFYVYGCDKDEEDEECL